jgi:hypothetical protein
MMRVDKKSILNDGIDAATIYLKLTNGWGRWTENTTPIDLTILSGQGELSETNPIAQRGRARVTLTSTTPGEVVIQAAYTLDNGNTITQKVLVEVLDSLENAASWVLATPGGSSATLSDPTIFNPTFTADI